MADTLGSWPNAPLGLVLAAINISHTPLGEVQIATIRESLGDRLPEVSQGMEGTVGPPNVQPFQPAPFWLLVSEDQGSGAVLKQTAIVVHATEYINYASFRVLISEVLTAFSKAVPAPIAVRAGLRYIDLIIPSQNETPDAYVHPAMHGVSLSEFEGIDTQSRAQSVRRITPNSALAVTYTRQTTETGKMPLPEGLGLFNLRPSAILLKGQDFVGQIGILDIDRWERFREKLSPEALLARFDRLHGDHSRAIRNVATEKALKVWGANNGG